MAAANVSLLKQHAADSACVPSLNVTYGLMLSPLLTVVRVWINPGLTLDDLVVDMNQHKYNVLWLSV